ncbi:protein mono-ADP-ribosyltransferase PARP12-like [Etheostoma cragini]|uniref:protein mono-ADP-ribosyltransferase PARP12-like n=1 Tax=Etheostoma cragini TaxID=417921 RepID=UPI00155EE1C1|nr:protein mono-ADP-ribosyltransferase PARP12-like [Etheostoma cragini]
MSWSGSGSWSVSSGSGSGTSGSGFSREVQFATALLCSNSGSMPLLQLHRELLQRCDITEEEFCWVLQRCPRFLLVSGPSEDGWLRPEDCTVVARTSLRLCGRQEECGGCEQLHLCKYFIYGNCRFGKGRKRVCKFSHDILSDQNSALLREFTLHELSEEQLAVLLLQNDNTLLPEVTHRDTHTHTHTHTHRCLRWFNVNISTNLYFFFLSFSVCSSGARPVDFLSWTRDSQAVRRLSTVSSVTKPPHYVLTTVWLWYYRAEGGNWVEYGQPDDRQRTTSVTSRTLEEAFQADRTAEVRVVKGQREYVVCFKDMYQRNARHRTKRRVCRRPRFVSVAEVTTAVQEP